MKKILACLTLALSFLGFISSLATAQDFEKTYSLGAGGRPDGGWVTRLGRGRRGPQRQPGRRDHHQECPPPGHAGTRPRVHRYSASRRLRPQAQPATITSAATIMPTASAVNASRPLRALAAKTAW